MSRPSVFASMPTYGGNVHLDAAMMFGVGATRECDVVWGEGRCSHPEHAFNECWVQALNARGQHGLTHFAMLHSDVVPEPYWIDRLVSIQQETGADLVSAVVPIKSPEGWTSTALCDPAGGGRGKVERVLNMHDVYRLPPTFGPEAFPGKRLLVNTGCFVARFDRDWCPMVWAQAKTWVSSGAGRGYTAHLWPSDWDFSLRVAEQGGRVLATRAVECYHGRPEWSNARPWGTAGVTEAAA